MVATSTSKNPMETRITSGNTAIIAVSLAFVLIPRSASGSSVVLTPPFGWNGFALSANIESGYRESDGGGVMATKNSTSMLVLPGRDGTPGLLIESMPISVTQSPTSGNIKDIATGEFKFSFTVGQLDASANDRFDFSLTNTTSAWNALVDFGAGPVHADAFFHASLTLVTMGPIRDSVGAFFGLPDMPILSSPTESMTATVTKGPWATPATLATLLPGETGVEVPLTMSLWSEQFTYHFTYDIVTPYGTDPTYSYSLNGEAGIAPIPEPTSTLSTLALISSGLLLRRRGKTSP